MNNQLRLKNGLLYIEKILDSMSYPDERKEKCYRFQSSLKDDIRKPLIPFKIEDYSLLVERDIRVEIDF
ncbi:hypothetical protein IEQ34_014489 [Dendrobium chrysotoxum]|uniref:Uncharacterized protein n=1 Tax=Dendrobium chrysotoxum TaxID=161865 RepID=A0AAV7GK05_DENCH|nr:hypothetical protein IEQ34_014489 [Dendrobium chrysotoxum]